jgi:hypothetical protein
MDNDALSKAASINLTENIDDKDARIITSLRLAQPAVCAWLQRELQAVLLQEDVGLLVQHCLGTLRYVAEGPRSKIKGRSFGLLMEEASKAISGCLMPYMSVPAHASILAAEMVDFLVSGLNIAAYDEHKMGSIIVQEGEGEVYQGGNSRDER